MAVTLQINGVGATDQAPSLKQKLLGQTSHKNAKRALLDMASQYQLPFKATLKGCRGA